MKRGCRFFTGIIIITFNDRINSPFRSFEIRDNGELILRSPGPFNGSLARLVAVASDTGKPPRWLSMRFPTITPLTIISDVNLRISASLIIPDPAWFRWSSTYRTAAHCRSPRELHQLGSAAACCWSPFSARF